MSIIRTKWDTALNWRASFSYVLSMQIFQYPNSMCLSIFVLSSSPPSCLYLSPFVNAWIFLDLTVRSTINLASILSWHLCHHSLENSYFQTYTQMFKTHMCISCSSLRISYFSMDPWFRIIISRKEDLNLILSIALRCHCFLGPLRGYSKETHTHTQIHSYVHLF